MSNDQSKTGDDRQVPVETYKCSQCNFYTNHEYYLQQHNLTHGLQALIDHRKRSTQSFSPNLASYAKIQIEPDTISLPSKTFQCIQCRFECDQEDEYKQHRQFCASYKTSAQDIINSYTNYIKPHLGLVIPSETFGSARIESDQEICLKPSHLSEQTATSLESMLIKEQDTEQETRFKHPINFSAYETHNENDSKQLELARNICMSGPELFSCVKCDFKTDQEKLMKQHIKEHEVMTLNSVKNNGNAEKPSKEVFRCNNCDYETNLKAFLKRHMQTHTVKIEVKEEVIGKYHCLQCDFETEHKKFLARHERSHMELRRFTCQKCSFETLYKKMYLKHLQAHKPRKNRDSDKPKEKPKTVSINCDECSVEVSSNEQLQIHKKLKHTPKDAIAPSLFNCLYCKYQTNWEPCLTRHVDREHPNRKSNVKMKKAKPKIKEEIIVEPEPQPSNTDLFRCYDCDFSSKSKQYLILHLKRSHIKTERVEKLTKKKYNKAKKEEKEESLTRSYQVRHRKHLFHFCDLCDYIAKSESNLAEHKKKRHEFRQVYRCNYCDFKTVYKQSLKTHSVKHKKYTCDVCDEELESAYALVKHRRGHQINPKNRIYLCDVCGFQSKNDRSLKMHKKTHNPEFKCPDCPFQTHSKVNFQNHCINHKGVDEVTMFPCPHCSYQSRLKRNLAWHMKRHVDPTKAQIFKCPQCDYQTFTNAQLKSHLMVHKSKEEVIMLKCDFCTFETKRKSNMVQHRLRHLKDSPDVPLLSCPDCNYTTVAKRHLNKHRKTHNVNPDKMFQCTYCPYKIHRKIYLMRHMENHKTVETFGNDQWQRYTFPPQSQIPITGVTVIPNLGQNIQNMGHNLM